jgi:4-hydroxybenzoate polyprenyltransferase
VRAVIKLLRPKQWSKNLLVLAAPIFAARITDSATWPIVGLAFLAMCLASSATYIVNDLRDAERDRQHEKKKHRPIASGAVSPHVATVLALVLGLGSLGIGFWLNTSSFTLIVTYFALQLLYNMTLKRAPIADVFTISLGFIIRAMLGAAAISVPISGWLLFCTGALALMIGFAKRRHEFIHQGDARTASRESLGGYNLKSLDALVIMTATGAAMSYGIYTLDSATATRYPAIVITSLFVFYGIARYVLITFTMDEGGEPADLLFGDVQLLASVVLFMASAIAAVSGMRLPLIER